MRLPLLMSHAFSDRDVVAGVQVDDSIEPWLRHRCYHVAEVFVVRQQDELAVADEPGQGAKPADEKLSYLQAERYLLVDSSGGLDAARYASWSMSD